MTVQELRDLLDAAQLVGPPPWTADRDEGLLDAKGEPLVYELDFIVAAVNALPALLDIADAAAELRDRQRAAAAHRVSWTGAAGVLQRIDAALDRLEAT